MRRSLRSEGVILLDHIPDLGELREVIASHLSGITTPRPAEVIKSGATGQEQRRPTRPAPGQGVTILDFLR